jgi:phenylalanyl-tRNA synthetase beta chain
MEFTFSWLKKFLKTDSTLEEIVSKLNELGLEVDEVSDPSLNLRDFIIAEISDISPHPSASKLTICQVFTGSETLQIICGASNVTRGLKVVLAPIGSLIPATNLKIKSTKIRDIDSNGMLCSAAELLLATHSDGIIELDPSAPIGEKFTKYMNLDDPIIKIAVTPNRGDCLGVYGIARDLSAAGLGELITPHTTTSKLQNTKLQLKIGNPTDCNVYYATIIKDIKNLKSPRWLTDTLKAIGVKSISAPVDIVNYIMYSFGQPMHTYDLNKIQGRITVRKATQNEFFTSLEGKDYLLSDNDLVIADEGQVIALAGIIGSQGSSCTSSTTSLLLEAANFDSKLIALTGRLHSIDTKSKYRYERKIDERFIKTANDLAIEMIIEICGGHATEGINLDMPSTQKSIAFNFSHLKTIGGIDIEQSLYETIISKLGFKFTKSSEFYYNLTVPSWRNDITIPEDIVEEILRIYSYDNIPLTNFIEQNSFTVESIHSLHNKLKVAATEIGYHEVVSYSFMDKKIASLFQTINEDLEISNPISSELNYLRPSILPNLLEITRKNQARNIDDLCLFEIGPIFNISNNSMESISFGAILTGFNTQNNLHADKREFDVYDIKFLAEEILSIYGYQLGNLTASQETPKYFHPTRSQTIYLDKQPIGIFGEINPFILKNFSLKKKILAVELFLDKIPYKPKKAKTNFSNYQAVERDFAFIIPKNLNAGNLLKIISKADSLITEAEIFDVYTDDTLGTEKKSVAIKVVLLSETKTLVENDIKQISDKIIQKATEIGAELRG